MYKNNHQKQRKAFNIFSIIVFMLVLAVIFYLFFNDKQTTNEPVNSTVPATEAQPLTATPANAPATPAQ